MSPEGDAATFSDHFSAVAEGYARYRPDYPDELFTWLASLCERRANAWDCATGSGQAAIKLSVHFESVDATDASAEQVAAARPAERVRYSVTAAEATPFSEHRFDLVTVGQALHWFDVDRFFAEVTRVTRPGGVLATWCYGVCNVTTDIDAVIHYLYADLTGPYWPPERAYIERGYRDFSLPGKQLNGPDFAMRLCWHVDDMLGYLRTWSACHRFGLACGEDPVDKIESNLREAWGDAARDVVWPVTLRVCRLPD